ncbi:MAG: acyltransferase family protein [Acidobacteriota bacterium]
MAAKERLVSLDAFRGFTIAGMMLVNNPGSWSTIYPQLEHASWNGWTFTDFIFPFFLWIVGVAMTMSFASRIERGDTKGKLMLQAAKRGAMIFAIGLLLTMFPFGLLPGTHLNFATLRIPGVLQRIGITYVLASAIYLNASSARAIVAWIVGILGAYWIMLTMVPVPEFGAGNLTPMGSIARWIDSMVIGTNHTWRGAPAPGFDPEGVISTLGAIGTALFGVLVGLYLKVKDVSKEEKTSWMFVAGSVLLLLGAIFDMWVPINKNLWTPSYVVFMAGFATCIFGMFYFLIDAKGYKKWATPLVIYGMNAIFVFALSGVLGRLQGLLKFNVQLSDGTYDWVTIQRLLMDNVFKPNLSPLNASLAWAILWDLMLFFFAWLMWRKKWFLKV